MSFYRIEWQMGGEMVLDIEGGTEEQIRNAIGTGLDIRANDMASDVAEDVEAAVRSGDGIAEITIARLS